MSFPPLFPAVQHKTTAKGRTRICTSPEAPFTVSLPATVQGTATGGTASESLSLTESSTSHGCHCTRLLCPWNSPGRNTGVGCHSLLRGIFPTQGSPLHLLLWQADASPLSHWRCYCKASKDFVIWKETNFKSLKLLLLEVQKRYVSISISCSNKKTLMEFFVPSFTPTPTHT